MFHITLTVSFLKWHHFTLIGLTNVLFGLLQWVEDSTSFLALSLTIRIVSAIGESAFFCAVFPLATKDVPEEKRATILAILETMGGLGN